MGQIFLLRLSSAIRNLCGCHALVTMEVVHIWSWLQSCICCNFVHQLVEESLWNVECRLDLAKNFSLRMMVETQLDGIHLEMKCIFRTRKSGSNSICKMTSQTKCNRISQCDAQQLSH